MFAIDGPATILAAKPRNAPSLKLREPKEGTIYGG
jgi:hypothetical protein